MSVTGVSSRSSRLSQFLRAGTLLSTAVRLGGFSLFIYGGFLRIIAPPDDIRPGFGVGTASILGLIAVLLISGIAIGKTSLPRRKRWLRAGSISFAVAVVCFVPYCWMLLNVTVHTEDTPPIFVTAGISPNADLLHDFPECAKMSRQELFVYWSCLDGYKQNVVWSESSIRLAQALCLTNYLLLVASFTVGVFCIVQGVLRL